MTPLDAYVVSFALGVGMKVVCFIIGYLVVRLGYKLLLLGVTGQFSFSAKWEKFNVGLASVSPGLLFVLLGCAVIAFGVYTEKWIILEVPPSVSEVKKRVKPRREYPPIEDVLTKENKSGKKEFSSP
jgi:hypothetical protein